MTVRLVLVDDDPLVLAGLRMLLEGDPGIEVVGEAADGDAAVRTIAETRPDVVLMDVRMPRLDGIEATARIVRELPATRVLVLTTFDLDDYAFGALAAGASGFLLKDARRDDLVAAVRAVERGDAVLAPRITRELIRRLDAAPQARAAASDLTAPLTERERDVFVAMARGRNNTEIAQELFLSESTVKTHVGRVLAKLGARDRIEAVILAHRHGIVDLDDVD